MGAAIGIIDGRRLGLDPGLGRLLALQRILQRRDLLLQRLDAFTRALEQPS